MSIILNKDELRGALKLLKLVAKDPGPAPLSLCVILTLDTERALLTADNGWIRAQASIAAQIGTNERTIVVPAERLYKIVSYAVDETVQISSVDDKTIEIVCGDYTTKLASWPQEEFLSWSVDTTGDTPGIDVPLLALQGHLENIKACGQLPEHTDPGSGYHFAGNGSQFRSEAMDGRMLHMAWIQDTATTIDARTEPEFIDIILAIDAGSVESNKTCWLSFYSNVCTLETDGILICSRLLNGQYADTSVLVTPKSENVIGIPVRDLVRSLRIACTLTAPTAAATVKIKSFRDEVVVTGGTPGIGEMYDVIKCHNEFQTAFYIDSTRLLASLKCLKEDTVNIQVDDPLLRASISEGSFRSIIATTNPPTITPCQQYNKPRRSSSRDTSDTTRASTSIPTTLSAQQF